MTITSKNAYLSRAEMEGNAEFITYYFRALGWTDNAIAAMLGNMESESTINPGIYESLDSSSTTNGFGLVQWTPNTKYKEWADANGYGSDYGDIVGQCHRIKYELENGLQWIPTTSFPLSFEMFSHATGNVEMLAYAFLYNYERPASLDQPNRQAQAVAWLEFIKSLDGGSVTPTPTPTKRKSMSKLLLYFAGSKR